jgi:hypothetical protein
VLNILVVDLAVEGNGNFLDRAEAVALVKEAVSSCLVHPSLVYLKERERGKYDLVFGGENLEVNELRCFAAKKKLMFEDPDEKGFAVIHKP